MAADNSNKHPKQENKNQHQRHSQHSPQSAGKQQARHNNSNNKKQGKKHNTAKQTTAKNQNTANNNINKNNNKRSNSTEIIATPNIVDDGYMLDPFASPLEYVLEDIYGDFLGDADGGFSVIPPYMLAKRLEEIDNTLDEVCPPAEWDVDEIYNFGDTILTSLGMEVEESGILRLVNNKVLKRYVDMRFEEVLASSQALDLIRDAYGDIMSFDLATLTHISAVNGAVMVAANHEGITEAMVCPSWTNTRPSNPIDTYFNLLKRNETGGELVERFAPASKISGMRFANADVASKPPATNNRRKHGTKSRGYTAKPTELVADLSNVLGFIRRVSRCGEGVLAVATPTNGPIEKRTCFNSKQPGKWFVTLYVVRGSDYVVVPSKIAANILASCERYSAIDKLCDLTDVDMEGLPMSAVEELEDIAESITDELPWLLESDSELDESESIQIVDLLLTALHEAATAATNLIPSGSTVVCTEFDTLMMAEAAPGGYVPWFVPADTIGNAEVKASSLMETAVQHLGDATSTIPGEVDGSTTVSPAGADAPVTNDDVEAIVGEATAVLEEAIRNDGNGDLNRYNPDRVAAGLGMLAIEQATLVRCLETRLAGNLEQVRGILGDSVDFYDEFTIRDDMTVDTLPSVSRLRMSIVGTWSREAEYQRDIKRFNELNGELPLEKRLPIEQWLDICSALADCDATIWAVESITDNQPAGDLQDKIDELVGNLMEEIEDPDAGIEIVTQSVNILRRDLPASERPMLDVYHRDELRALATRCLLNEGGAIMCHSHGDNGHGIIAALGNKGDSYTDNGEAIAEYVFGTVTDSNVQLENEIECIRFM